MWSRISFFQTKAGTCLFVSFFRLSGYYTPPFFFFLVLFVFCDVARMAVLRRCKQKSISQVHLPPSSSSEREKKKRNNTIIFTGEKKNRKVNSVRGNTATAQQRQRKGLKRLTKSVFISYCWQPPYQKKKKEKTHVHRKSPS